ncbi:MAG: peroxide stress protein YaaA [Bacteroidetes bacterium]|nr:MAG: peroxide stress protein YaaA [Bacteroidota bacterium]
MIVIISPAKNINFDNNQEVPFSSEIRFPNESEELLHELKKYTSSDISKLMKVSSKISQLNFERFQSMNFPFDSNETKSALLVFNGAVFQSMNINTFSKSDLEYAQQKLRILSGFYGLLRPLDGIMPYRLEMGTHLPVKLYKNLYSFWGDKLTTTLQNDIDENGDDILINLASNEYFKAINTKKINARIITPEFKDFKNDKYKVISIYAKQARGMMSKFILTNRIEKPDELKLFNTAGYQYNDNMSTSDKWVFIRG